VFEIDEWFYDRLQHFEFTIAVVIVAQIVDISDSLPKLNGFSQTISGMIDSKTPIYFRVDYLHQEEEIPVFVDVEEIDCDGYLDDILENKTIKQIENEIKSKENKESNRTEESD